MKVLFTAWNQADDSMPLSRQRGLDLAPYLERHNCEFFSVNYRVEMMKFLPTVDVLIVHEWSNIEITEYELSMASNLKLIIVVGPTHANVDFECCRQLGITLAKVPYTSRYCFSEAQLLHILQGLQMQDQVLQGRRVALIGAGYTAAELIKKLKAFDVKIEYFDQHQWEPEEEQEFNMTWHPTVELTVRDCDIVVSNCPLDYGGILVTNGLFNSDTLNTFKPGAMLLIGSPKKTYVQEDVSAAVISGQISYFAGSDELRLPSLDYQTDMIGHAQSILDSWFDHGEIGAEWLLVHNKKYVCVPGCDCFNLAGWHA